MFMRILPPLLMAFMFSVRAFAGCEGEVQAGAKTQTTQLDPDKIYRPAAFGISPNDAKGGLVTDVVPINVPNLISGYSGGLFAYFSDENGIGRWFNPPTRGILRINKAHFGSRMIRRIENRIRSGEISVTFNRDFKQVIEKCATVPRSTGEWISPTHVAQYTKLHEAGFAHSVEVWRGQPGQHLIGGLYFVYVKGVASGESMFRDPSENYGLWIATYALIKEFKKTIPEDDMETFIDMQMHHGISVKLGGEELSRFDYMRQFKAQQKLNLPISEAFIKH